MRRRPGRGKGRGAALAQLLGAEEKTPESSFAAQLPRLRIAGGPDLGNAMSTVPISMQELLDAGVHFGHQTRRWHPNMKPFLYGERNGIHIINLQYTLPRLRAACDFAAEAVASGGSVLFVGTKRQASGRGRRGGQRGGHALRAPPLAGRHAHELPHRAPQRRALQGADRAAEQDDPSGPQLSKKERRVWCASTSSCTPRSRGSPTWSVSRRAVA